jgi:fructuronate reductase
MVDPARAGLVATRRRSRSTAEFAAAVLDEGLLGRELAARTSFTARVAELIDVIVTHGPITAATEAAQAADAEKALLSTP